MQEQFATGRLLLQQLVEPGDLEPHDDRLIAVVAQVPAVDTGERHHERAPLRATCRLPVELTCSPV
jgi:hypothetical protein